MSEPQAENPPLDSEDWNIVFQVYAEYPILAFILAQHLDFVKVLIEHSPEGQAVAIAGLERAIEGLFPYTMFRDIGHNLYLSAVAGKLSPEQSEMLRKLRSE